LSYDGRIIRLPVAGETVGDALVAAGIGDVRGLSIEPPPSTPLTRARRVEVTEPVTVVIEVDGARHRVRLRDGTVADALDLAGVAVGSDDEVAPAPGTPVDKRTTVRVTRHGAEEVVEEVALPFDEQVVDTDDLHEGEQAIVREGAEGLRRDTYRVELVDGEKVDRELVDREVVTEPVDRVVHVGTAPPPAPEPPP